jgi:tripartite-type tricarboxylate transporter receptor subunit TctC
MKLSRRAILAGTVALASPHLPASAQLPNRGVTLVVPAPPGGHTDIAARLVAEGLAPRLGVPVVVDNRPGGNGVVGAQAVIRARPDGTTLFVAFSGFMVGIPAVTRDLGVDTRRDLLPVAMLMEAPHVALVPASLGVRTLAEFVALAKARPGRMNYASVGVGSIHHLGPELLKQRAGIDLAHVPYRGDAPALQDLLVDRVQLYFATLPAAQGFVRDGRLRALAVGAPRRLPPLPEVPTTAEAGFPGLEVSSWYGLFAPAGTPDATVAALARESDAVTGTEEFRRRALELGSVVQPRSPAEMAEIVSRELAGWTEVVRAAGIEPL